nr:hypothetical protein [Tanacetum cinerariifolium]
MLLLNLRGFVLLFGIKDVASQDVKKDVSSLRYIALPNWFHEAHLESSTSNAQDTCNAAAPVSCGNSNPTATSKDPLADQMETLTVESVIPTVSSPVLTACLDDSLEPSSDTRHISKGVTSQDETPSLDNISTLSNRFEDILGVTPNTVDANGVEANLSNMESIILASYTPTFRIHTDHPKSKIIVLVDTLVQTRHLSKEMEEHSFEEPEKIFDALKDPSWVEAMQEELLQFKIQNVWILVDCPKGVRPIRTKWVFRNKKDERGIVIRNKARLVAQGHTQEEGVGNKMHKAFPLLVRKFPLPEGTSHFRKKNATARRKVMPLPEDYTAVIVKKKLSVKDDDFLKISAPCPALYSSSNRKCNIVYKDSLYS